MNPGRRWIRGLILILALGSAGLLGGVGYFLWKPTPLPEAAVAQGRLAYIAARLSKEITSEDLAEADSLSLVMEGLYARESGRWIKFRRPLELAAAAEKLRVVSCRAESTAAADLAGRLADNRIRREGLEQRLDRLAAEVAAMPGAKHLRRAYRHAEMALGAARELEQTEQALFQVTQLDSAAVAVGRAEMLYDRRFARFADPRLRDRWQTWVDQTVAATLPDGTALVVDKLNRSCLVIRNRRVVARLEAELGRNGLADKLHAGDGATPEGRYRVAGMNNGSKYYRALLLDYPQGSDIARHRQAEREGRIPAGTGPGGLIEIHGHGGRGTDWTEGCIAVSDADMDLLFSLVAVGTPVTIVGTAQLRGE